MTKEEVKAFVVERIEEKVASLGLEIPSLSDELHLTGSGIFDSMDFFGLITDTEDAYNIEIDFTSYDPQVFTTLGGFVECVLSAEYKG